MKISFQKFEGAGNDFVVIDNRNGRITRPRRLARILCDRHRSVGGDGMLLLEASEHEAYRMMYYNADGSYGGMCGNGGRCISMYAYLNGIARKTHVFEALGYAYRATIVGGSKVRLRMKDPIDLRRNVSLPSRQGSFLADFIDTGSPHAVIEVRKGTLQKLELETIGPWIRRHRAFQPHGVNVNFVERIGSNSLKMRTFERGVEAETLACGTGSVACSIVGAIRHGMRSPVTVVAASGDRLRITFQRTPHGFREVVLEGPAKRTFQGTVDV